MLGTPNIRRLCRRHSISTFYDVKDRYLMKESHIDIGNASNERRDIHCRTTKRKRLSIKESLFSQDENEVVSRENVPDKLSCDRDELISSDFLLVKNSVQNKRRKTSGNKDVYDSLMDLGQTLDEIHPVVKRRSLRNSAVRKENNSTLNNSDIEEISNKALALKGTARKKRRISNNTDVEQDSERTLLKKRRLSLDDAENYQKLNKNTLVDNSVVAPYFKLNNIDLQEIQDYYLDKTIKKTKIFLETIFEDPNTRPFGKREIRRLIQLNDKVEFSKCMKRLNTSQRKLID